MKLRVIAHNHIYFVQKLNFMQKGRTVPISA